jgi:intracellular septation protein A
MILALRALLVDFLATLVFIAIAGLTGQPRLAVIAAVATGLGQMLLQLARNRPIDAMQWFGLLLTLVFGTVALTFHDLRFVMAKPSIIHFAIGGIMLRRGWMARYVPDSAIGILPGGLVVGAGYAWAALMFCLGVINLVVAFTLPLWVWSWFISLGAIGAKLCLLLGQYVVFRRVARKAVRSRHLLAIAG